MNRNLKKNKRTKAMRRRKIRLTVLLLLVGAAAVFLAWKAVGLGKISGQNIFATNLQEEMTGSRDIEASGGLENASMKQADILTLTNKWNRISEDYGIDLVKVDGGESVDSRIYEPLMEMLEAAKAANGNQLPAVVSGYRTAKKQQELYEEKIKEYERQGYSEEDAVSLAEQWVAIPGTSEHQLGLAVDINGELYDVYLWLQENSYKYGFIFRYPGSKTDLTGVAEEVWHYRYVGKEAAEAIYQQGICLEEYVGMR